MGFASVNFKNLLISQLSVKIQRKSKTKIMFVIIDFNFTIRSWRKKGLFSDDIIASNENEDS